MNEYSRRAFGAGLVTTALGLTAAAADPVKESAEPVIEFDGRPHQNPTAKGAGTFAAKGTIRPPAGHTIETVTVRHQKDGAGPASGATTIEAKIDKTQNPPTWSAESQAVEVGEYWVDAWVTFLAPGKGRVTFYSMDKRRVFVPESK